MIRPRRAIALGFLLALGACATAPPSGLPRVFEPTAPPPIVVAVADLDAAAVDAAIAAAGHRAPDLVLTRVFASGAGVAAAVTPFGRRPALDVLLDPRPLALEGRPVVLHGVSRSLRSRPAHRTIFDAAPIVTDDDLPTLGPRDDVAVPFVLLDATVDAAAVLDAIATWRRSRDDDPTVVLYGFPDRVGDPARDLFVPVYVWSSGADGVARVDSTTHDLTGRFLDPLPSPDDDFRWAAWPGGVFARDGATSLRSTPEGFAYGGAGASDPVARQALADRLAVTLFGGPPRVWIAVRGSEAVDFVDLSVFGHMPLTSRLTPWALEDIDNVWAPNDNAVRYSLGAEGQGDGALLDLGWPPFRFELRLTGTLKDSLAEHGWLGTPMYVGAPPTLQGFDTLVVEPWTRTFWRASAGNWPARADDWWPGAPAGVHVGIDGGADAPAPAPLD